MANKYAVGSGTNWSSTSSWADSSGGASGATLPSSGDNVFFDTNSPGNITIDSGAFCRSINCNGFTNSLIHSSGVTLTIGDSTAGASNIALKFVSGMTYSLGSLSSSAINFVSTSSTQQSIILAGKNIAGWTFNGAGGSWIFASAVTQNPISILKLTAGTLTDNGSPVTGGSFSSNNSNVRSLVKTANWVLSGTSTPWDTGTSTNLTISDSGTTTIADTSSANKIVQSGGVSGLGTFIVASSSSGSVKFNGGGSYVGIQASGVCSIIFANGSTVTIATAVGWNVSGTAGNMPTLTSSSPGNQWILSVASGSVTSDYISLQDGKGTGGATFTATNSTNISNNTAWSFPNPIFTVPWSGLGINYGYYNQPANHVAELQAIYNLGFRRVRIANPIYTDTTNITYFRTVVQAAISIGFTTVIYGLGVSGHPNSWSASDEPAYLSAIEAEATWAQSLASNVLWFSVGNESTNWRNSSTLTALQVRTFMRSCATSAKSIYTYGKVIYAESADYSSPYLAPLWASEGLGDLDMIGWNIYGDPALNPPTNFTTVLSQITNNLSTSQAFFSEFSFSYGGSNGYTNTTSDTQGTGFVSENFQILIDSGYSPALFYTWQDTGNLYGAVLYPSGVYRGALAVLLGMGLSPSSSQSPSPSRSLSPSSSVSASPSPAISGKSDNIIIKVGG